MPFQQRLRAATVSALLWGGAWSVAYAAVEAVALVGTGQMRLVISYVLQNALRAGASGAVWGLVAGAAFAIVFGWTQRGRRVAQLSRARAALWGAVAGAAVPAVELANALARASGPIGFRWGSAALLVSLGALSAAAAVHVANRAAAEIEPPSTPPELASADGWPAPKAAARSEPDPVARRAAT